MKVYYDTDTMNIILQGVSRYFANGTLEAIEEGGKVAIRNKATLINELYLDRTGMEKEDGSPIGADNTIAINYLNEEFNKGMSTGVATFALLGTTATVNDPKVKGNNKVMVSAQAPVVNEIIFVTAVSDGSFTVNRIPINTALGLTTDLPFNYIKF
jgi:hypothetical protein